MNAVIYGVLLCRKTKGIVAHRVQHVEALQPFVTGKDIAGNISQRMPHVQSCAAGIGEHVQHIVLWLQRIVAHFIGIIFFPFGLPALFYLPEIIFHIVKAVL